jgi:hypothetical protein
MSTFAMCNSYVFFSYRLCKCVLQSSFVLQKVRGKSSCISNLCISLYHCIVFWIMRIKIDICLCVCVSGFCCCFFYFVLGFFLRSRGGCIDNIIALCIINLNHSCFYFLTATSMESWVAMKNVVGLSLGSLWQYPVLIPRLDFHNLKCISTHCTWAEMFLIILLQTPFHV